MIVALAALSALGSLWTPLLLALPLLAMAVAMSLAHATLSATRASFTGLPRSRISRLVLRSLQHSCTCSSHWRAYGVACLAASPPAA